MATVSTNIIGSGCEFVVCSEEEYETLTEEEAASLLIDSMWESEYLDLYINRK